MRVLVRLLWIAPLAAFAAGCSGTGGERQLPAAPSEAANLVSLTAPTPVEPGDDVMVNTLRPTLRVRNATSSVAGSRMYEFQIADNPSFTVVANRPGAAVVTVTQAGIPEGADGTTAYTVPVDLLPANRYHWRARAIQGASVGPWSQGARFRTKVESYKSGNQLFDILSNGRTVADEIRSIAYEREGEPNPGAKLSGNSAYLLYRISPLPEGEVSMIVRRVKPGERGVFFSMQDGKGDFDSNAFRVRVERPDISRLALQFVSRGDVRPPVETDVAWEDHRPYYFKLEWRGGTARLRVYPGENDAAEPVADLSSSYAAPYNPASHMIVVGSLAGRTISDIRVSRVYVGPGPRLVALHD